MARSNWAERIPRQSCSASTCTYGSSEGRPADDNLNFVVVLPDELYHLVDRLVDDIERCCDADAIRILIEIHNELFFFGLKKIDVANALISLPEEVSQINCCQIGDIARLETRFMEGEWRTGLRLSRREMIRLFRQLFDNDRKGWLTSCSLRLQAL